MLSLSLGAYTDVRYDRLCRLDEREDGGELQNYLQVKTGQRTVPNIFISAC
jgi:glutaredoxin